MKFGAAVYYALPLADARSSWLYLGSLETSMCLLRRVFSGEGDGASQSSGVSGSSLTGLYSSGGVKWRDAIISYDVCGRVPASVSANTRSSALYVALRHL